MNCHKRITITMAALWVAIVACAQWSFTVDPTFQTQLVQQNVNSLLLNEDGTLIASGRMRLLVELSDKTLCRFLSSGSRDESFNNSGMGGGKLIRWEDRFYASTGVVRRLNMDGTVDASFSMQTPFFVPLQGGDYHVYPDGRVLISGNHQLNDSIRGFVGRHQLIWFTNEGYLDTTRTHRTGGNCAVYRFAELPNGQFICSGLCNQFDGQEIDRIFRVHADGSVDTTFRTGVFTGIVGDYLPLDDGRVYVAGNFRRTEAPLDTLRLVRFMPDGTLDPSFAIPQFSIGTLPGSVGSLAVSVQHWLDGNLMVTGFFTSVNGQQRGGICLLDTAGNVLPAFANSVLGPYTFGTVTYASIESMAYDTANAQLYVCGAYSGYNDGLNNYPQQRFITRLNVQEISTGVDEEEPLGGLQLYPNPASGTTTLELPHVPPAATVLLRDALGRVAHQQRVQNHTTTLDLRSLAGGIYTVEVSSGGRRVAVQRLVVGGQ